MNKKLRGNTESKEASCPAGHFASNPGGMGWKVTWNAMKVQRVWWWENVRDWIDTNRKAPGLQPLAQRETIAAAAEQTNIRTVVRMFAMIPKPATETSSRPNLLRKV